MTLPLNPQILRSSYDFLRTTKPFCGWKLPDGDTVEFRVTRIGHEIGSHQTYAWRRDEHIIEISELLVGHTQTLIQTMAHEMIHAAQVIAGTDTKGQHNADFHARAAKVCKYHGFDLKGFV